MLNQFDLRILGNVQNHGTLKLNDSKKIFNRSSSTVKRSVNNLNIYLPKEKKLYIKNNIVYSRLSYDDKLFVINSLHFLNYKANQEERIELILFSSFFFGVVNLTELYDSISMSQTTKKKDRKHLQSTLGDQLQVKAVRGRGIEICGNESFYRMFIAHRLSQIIECDEHFQIHQRAANNPVENAFFNIFWRSSKEIFHISKSTISAFFRTNDLRADYASKKLLLIYDAIARIRINHNNELHNDEIPNVAACTFARLYENNNEDLFFNILTSSLNYSVPIEFPRIKKLEEYVREFSFYIQKSIKTKIINFSEFTHALYKYLYKCLLKNTLGYYFYDDKLDEVRIEYPHIYLAVSSYLVKCPLSDNEINFELRDSQIGTLSLIISTFILQNKIYKKNKKNIIIITNSSIEKINFFSEQLKQYIDFNLQDTLTLNELYKLNELPYDAIITFSSRITDILRKKHILAIKLPFYIEEIDIKPLKDLGFRSNFQRKLEKEKFVKEIINKTDQEILSVLNQYPDYFI